VLADIGALPFGLHSQIVLGLSPVCAADEVEYLWRLQRTDIWRSRQKTKLGVAPNRSDCKHPWDTAIADKIGQNWVIEQIA